ncbi:hypothetical protein KY495_00175 [Massilia sp. PAMC28688]|uniref:hypothetical protein n=1 Tax=Massilia sp. PAMC28688 TaxID=2861283 RepID=UPI001C62A05A|nr:hypothetical protein [Massilia sp. PAMC28688]QYF93697.1 hypothetical protein KY495_00175 [Massilia sp. PAMC28688]
MSSKIAAQERQHFSDRLRERLREAGVQARASVVAHEFNLRADGASITTHAARKWLLGEALPTHERMVILASWLGVHASWLQYGDADNGAYTVDVQTDRLETVELILLRDFRRLPDFGKKVVQDVISSLLSVAPADNLRSRTDTAK